jgi:hypothetical protein
MYLYIGLPCHEVKWLANNKQCHLLCICCTTAFTQIVRLHFELHGAWFNNKQQGCSHISMLPP